MAETDDEEELDITAHPEQSFKKKILLYLVPVIILIGIGVGLVTVFFTQVGEDEKQNYDIITQKNADGSGEKTTVFYTLPEFNAQLRTSTGIYETISVKVNLELSNIEDVATINIMMPRINDIIITHLAELSPEEVGGAEGIYALKSELLYRINLMVAPIKVSNINIKDLDIKITDSLEKQED